MKNIGKHIYSNFQYSPIQKKQQQVKANAIILGYSGSGKTSLFNNLCGTSEPVGASQQSLTSSLSSADCSFLPKDSLQMIDTPGIVQGKGNGFLQIYRSLRYINWNLIIIMCRYEINNKSSNFSTLKKLLKLFSSFSNHILIMFSNSDQIQAGTPQQLAQNQALGNFNKYLKQNQINLNTILFSNKKSDYKKLSQIIYYSCNKNKKNIILLDTKLCQKYLNFNKFYDKYQQLLQKYLQKLNQIIKNQSHPKFNQLKNNIISQINLIANKQNQQYKKSLILVCQKYIQQKINKINSNQSQSKIHLNTQTSTGTLRKQQRTKSKQKRSASIKNNLQRKKRSANKLTKFTRTSKLNNTKGQRQKKIIRSSRQIAPKSTLFLTNIKKNSKQINDPEKQIFAAALKFSPINIQENSLPKFSLKCNFLTEQQRKKITQSKWVSKQEAPLNSTTRK